MAYTAHSASCLDHFYSVVLRCAHFSHLHDDDGEKNKMWRCIQFSASRSELLVHCECICVFFSRSLSLSLISNGLFPFFPSSFLLLILNWCCTILIAVYGRLYCAFLFHCSINGLVFWRRKTNTTKSTYAQSKKNRMNGKTWEWERQKRNGKSNKHFDFKHIEIFLLLLLSSSIYT